MGLAVETFSSQAGVIDFNPDVFLRQGKNPPAAQTSANSPATPTVAGAVNAAVTDAEWEKLLGAAPAATGFGYAVTGCNRFGESAPAFSGNVAITAAQLALQNSIQVTVTNAAAIGPNPPEYFIIYRTIPGNGASVNVTEYSEIARFAATTQAAGAGNTPQQDRNVVLPFTETAYLGELTPSVLTFRQLAPLMRMDLAILAPAYRWMILMYGTPILFAPAKWVRLINIGRLT